MVVGFNLSRTGRRWVFPGSLVSLAKVLGVGEVIRGRRFHPRGPWVSLGSYRVVGFTLACLGDR